MEKIRSNVIIPSAAYSVPKSLIKQYDSLNRKTPEVGDLVFGEIFELGHHRLIESRSARMHTVNIGTRAIFVYGNRYAPDQYEGLVPDEKKDYVELFSRGGVIGEVQNQNQLIGRATKVKVLGYVCKDDGSVINTKDHVLLKPKEKIRNKQGSKLILCVGTSMNSGKTEAAAACCYAISSMGRNVRAAKLTGTASLKDILLMNDCGAENIADFTYFGYPSTYLMDLEDLLKMFNDFDMKYGNNPKNYLVIEFADGIFQRETAKLLKSPIVRDRIHKLIFCAPDSTAVFGGINILKEEFDLVPDAISGICSSSPLAMREIESFTDLPIIQSMEKDFKKIFGFIG
ncbi:MAG: hypothetical protein K1566_18250 [Candidatus Thiodiazotropha sp. (ex. Lucinisca nassula)]|nr:hypothetical protein [Candidatus Thiodiazotropha sp. (ex. Lucinisca nassula)]MBW9271584.1 hypothetical protein [Candidatus Thiodiazotropha sp. (ex. Lucinisca nassula)]